VVTQNTAGATQHTRIALPAPEIDWDYAVIERFDKDTLKTSLIPFDLGKLVMAHDPSQDLRLQPGDVVSVFSQADIHVPIAQQTKFVRLEGEFVHAGTYSVKPGETLPELVARAGGLTPNAYLYGSEFTRESTRVIQQQRIDEYVQNLQLETTRGNIAQTSSAAASAQDVASANASVAIERDLISRLQQVRATGRIVLNEKPESSGITALPPMQLEDGDRFIVPSVPLNVNVVGAVYDQNSFLFAPNSRVADYLHLAGGPNRDADNKHAFIIRADGSVLSRAAASGIWGNTFDSMRINPGDTVVVPEKIYRPGGMRAFLDWTQVFSQLALGVAAFSIVY
jgi:protein involved in polysaccharide export with SLBB domain